MKKNPLFRSYTIVTDTTSDLPMSYYNENNLISLSLVYSIDGVEFAETKDSNIDSHEFYEKLRNGAQAKTSQVTPDKAIEVFRDIAANGNDILYIGFSSGLSGTFQSVQIAKTVVALEFPNARIMIVDSLAASLGQGLLVDFAVNMYNKQHQADELDVLAAFEHVENIKLNICQYFTVDDLNYLYRGGRVTKSVAFFGTLLGIKPMLHVNNEGKLIAIGKVRGRKQSLDSLVQKMIAKTENMGNVNKQVFISHGDCIKDAEYVATKIESVFGIKAGIINFVGPVIGSHSGPGTVALFFVGADRDEIAL